MDPDTGAKLRIALITGSRAEWRLVHPVYQAAQSHPRLTPQLLVTGTHLSVRHGRTLDAIHDCGVEPAACIPALNPDELDPDSDAGVALACGRALSGFAGALSHLQPEWVVLTGDRYETFAAGFAAAMLRIPIAHVAGGETDVATNQDCNLRNALTKLAHLHLVSCAVAAARVRALGEEPWRIHTTGLPSLDGIEGQAASFELLRRAADLPSGCRPRSAAQRRDRRFALINFLPVTLEARSARMHLEALLTALAEFPELHKLFVLSNGDAGGAALDARISAWSHGRRDVSILPALPPELYLAALRDAAVCAGNSSSFVIESPAFGTPAVIVGPRQSGRPLADSTMVLQRPTPRALVDALARQLAHGTYEGVSSPYGRDDSAARVCAVLCEFAGDPRLQAKRLWTGGVDVPLVAPLPTAPRAGKAGEDDE